MHPHYTNPRAFEQEFDVRRAANGLPPFFARARRPVASSSSSPVLTPAEIEALLVELELVGSNDDAPAATVEKHQVEALAPVPDLVTRAPRRLLRRSGLRQREDARRMRAGGGAATGEAVERRTG